MFKAQRNLFTIYLLVLLLLLSCSKAFSQIEIIHFNAGFNSVNNVAWFSKLKECDRQTLLIEQNDNQTKYEIAVVPTIVVFDDGEEVKRFQADISFKMVATRKEVQEYIDELIISKF
jgi:thiol-disulfide isomerase/thioredoxin|tara:strand:+ start:507 stop:857 length:351 start_codon:yes stop_codon:yes gene_type:complete